MDHIKFRTWDEKENNFCIFSVPYMSVDTFHFLQEPASDNRVFEQYIGRKDKTGKKIYEGDILRSYILKYFSNQEVVTRVVWNDKLGSFKLKTLFDGVYPKGRELNLNFFNNVEIIGNIHES